MGAPPKTLGFHVSLLVGLVGRLLWGGSRAGRGWKLGGGEGGIIGDVQMAVEVDDADGAVGAVDAPEQRESDGVVAAEGDDAR